jgi:ribosomal protein S18 acetylase RimI-like enzyme
MRLVRTEIRPRGRGTARTYRPVEDGVVCDDATQRSADRVRVAVSGRPPAIRPATTADIPYVLELWSQARSANASTPDTPRSLEALLSASPGALLVAQREADGIVGALIAGWDGWRGNMYRLAVHPQRRREGIARALVEHGERHLRSKGARRITALVAHEELEAVAFWREAGYARDTTIARFVKQLGD